MKWCMREKLMKTLMLFLFCNVAITFANSEKEACRKKCNSDCRERNRVCDLATITPGGKCVYVCKDLKTSIGKGQLIKDEKKLNNN